jgi:hypothetical protein
MRTPIKTSSSGVKVEIAGAGLGVQQQASRVHAVERRQDVPVPVLARGKSERDRGTGCGQAIERLRSTSAQPSESAHSTLAAATLKAPVRIGT